MIDAGKDERRCERALGSTTAASRTGQCRRQSMDRSFASAVARWGVDPRNDAGRACAARATITCMTQLVAACPRCGARNTTLDVPAVNTNYRERYEWQLIFEVFCVCRACLTSSIRVIELKEADDQSRKLAGEIARGRLPERMSLDTMFKSTAYISIKDEASVPPPEHLPGNIALAFREGATSVATQCWNAAGAMFRLSIDLATKTKLPPAGATAINDHQRRNLAARLKWMFANGVLPRDLERLSDCIREDGNDGAHDATLTEADALDLQDFAVGLLERIFTEPKRIELSEQRRIERRKPKA
jgi:hypothetical protein